MFLVKATSVTDAIAALTTDDVNLRNVTNAAANPSAWSLPNIFIGVTIARAVLQFSQIFLALLSGLILIGYGSSPRSLSRSPSTATWRSASRTRSHGARRSS